jgi:hypothetical protein
MSWFRQRVDLGQCAAQIPLRKHSPSLTLSGLLPGIDNVRHDVSLSPKFAELARAHIARLIVLFGDVKDLCPEERPVVRPPSVIVPGSTPPRGKETLEFKDALPELLTLALNRAKTEDNLGVETLCRLSVIKLLRQELAAQFTAVLKRCQAYLQHYENGRPPQGQRGIELRERTAKLQLAKKTILRKVGQELLSTLRDAEKTVLARMRRSLFGNAADVEYELFLNRLLFTPDGRDDFLSAEHYVMLGNYERDPDRLDPLKAIAGNFLHSLGYATEGEGELDALLSEPENAPLLLSAEGEDPLREAVLAAWVERLESGGVLAHVLAAYAAAPLLAEYSPPIHPQQLKCALISREERKRVENLLEEHGKLSPENLWQAARRVEHASRADQTKLAVRFLGDFLRYYRDLRRMQALEASLDAIHLITGEKLRQLSAVNHTLYEFLLAQDRQEQEEKVVSHVIVKADIRDSTGLVQTLFERGLNPASHFSLKFYEPVNKLLPKYRAQKLFIEGDAVILALFEREGQADLPVARACVLAREMIEIVRGYNEQSQKDGLPVLELGIGIAFQDTAPMYLMDGTAPVMISSALNVSDRLASSSKSARRLGVGANSVFNVYQFQTVEDADTAGQPEEFLIRYNMGGILLGESAFQKLQREISLSAQELALPTVWGENKVRIYSGTVAVAPGVVHRVAIREARVPHIDARERVLKRWTDLHYYEVCTHTAVYELLDTRAAATGNHG